MNWSDQTAPISNFDYLFNMMDDTPAMEEEVVDDMSMTDTSYKSGKYRCTCTISSFVVKNS